MYKEEIFAGPSINLYEILEAREERALYQEEIFRRFFPGSLLSITLNIPGDVKTSAFLQNIFDEIIKEIEQTLSDVQVKCQKTYHLKTGSEAYFFTDLPAEELKKRMVHIEEQHIYGRIFDLDVLFFENDTVKAIKREEIGAKKRKCFVCNRLAKECARSQRHSIEEMQKAIFDLFMSTHES